MCDKQTPKKRFLLPVITGVCVAATCVLVVIAIDSSTRDGPHLMITMTSGGLEFVAGTVQMAVMDSGKQAPKEIELMPRFINESGMGPVEEVISPDWLDSETGLFVDAWHRPIKLVVRSRHDYTFISAGPDGKFKGGKGDDIVHQFDPWKKVEDVNESELQPPAT
jgi:hypothetical protein